MDRAPVTHTSTERRIGHFPSGRDLSVTVHRYDGDDGPTVFVQAAQHGIELNGPAALRRLHDRLLDAELAGTVLAVPVANPLAFDHRSYLTPEAYDALNPNFNRIWPGDAGGSFQERLVARLWPLVETADAAVDLHTGTPEMLEHVRYRAGDGDARRLAAAFGTDVILADEDPQAVGDERGESDDGVGSDDDNGDEDAFTGKFRLAAARAGVPAVTAELSNSRTVRQPAVESGVDGVWNVLRELDAVEGSPDPPSTQRCLRDDAPRVVAETSGLFELRADLDVGGEVEIGEELGAVFDPSSFERLETVVATADGVVYSVSHGRVVVTGERLASIATPK
jgi:predicted deacylase